MEIVETAAKRKAPSCTRTITCPCRMKYAKRYVQPPCPKSFAPERVYRAPSKKLDTGTTYCMSYLSVDPACRARPQPIRPATSLERSDGKFLDDTTTKLSYRPVWGMVKAEPIVPKYRLMTGRGPMENVTTARRDYVARRVERPGLIVPCGSIRTSSAPLEDKTMTRMSYMTPGPVEPAISFKPVLEYRPPSQPLPKETTQKLSYQPFVVGRKEPHPWVQRPVYKYARVVTPDHKSRLYTRIRLPDTAMCAKTTYSESYMENRPVPVEKPCVSTVTHVFPYGAEFADKTVYKESYLPSETERAIPFVPSGNISIPDVKMSADTTNKLSYQQVWQERRRPFMPVRVRHLLGTGKMQSETTTRCEYAAKATAPPVVIVPCDNIRTADAPLEGVTITGLSYMKPGAIKPVRSYRPVRRYCRPEAKIDFGTVNKLSYQTWTVGPREELPWTRKSEYRPPEQPMADDTVYHMSYPAPGYYVEEEASECPCANEEERDTVSCVSAKAVHGTCSN